jgi:hypothetical protein
VRATAPRLLPPATELALTYLLGPTALFVIGTFFFVSGRLAEFAMARKGPARFAADRLLRLGVPYLVFMALLWPMFMWGVAAARRDWYLRAPRELCRACGWAVVAVLVAAPVIAVAAGVTDVAADGGPFLGGPHWQALVLAGVEACLVVAGSVWLCGLAQRRLADTGRRWTAWSRASYAAFLLQAPVLLTLAMVLRPMSWPAEGKAAVVAGLGVPVCFWLGRHLTRTGLRRIV